MCHDLEYANRRKVLSQKRWSKLWPRISKSNKITAEELIAASLDEADAACGAEADALKDCWVAVNESIVSDSTLHTWSSLMNSVLNFKCTNIKLLI
jgi:hypothetical protein